MALHALRIHQDRVVVCIFQHFSELQSLQLRLLPVVPGQQSRFLQETTMKGV